MYLFEWHSASGGLLSWRERTYQQVSDSFAVVAHLPCHLLILEHLAGVLSLSGRADVAVLQRAAVRGRHASEIPPEHCARKPVPPRIARHIHVLAGREVPNRKHVADWEHIFWCHRELEQLHLGRDVRLDKMPDLRLFQALQVLLSAPDLN